MRILNIQRMSTEDGPGLRTTVFFKGCPLKCAWCHNPESIPYAFDKEWIKTSCIFCFDCVNICEQNAISFKDGEIVLDREKCNLCMKCVDVCPTQALKQIGRDIKPEELFKELIKDKAFFSNGGGVTLSGGEVLLQSDEVVVLMKLLKEENIHIAIDTSGFVSFDKLQSVLDYTDLFLYDLKIMSEKLHKEFCGAGNKQILENLIKLNESKVRLWIRTPIIPGATDTNQNIKDIANFLGLNNINFERWELCAFNNLCRDKYERLGLEWNFKDSKLMAKERMNELGILAKSILQDRSNSIYTTGATKLEVK